MSPIEIGMIGIGFVLLLVFGGVGVGAAMAAVGFVGIAYQVGPQAAFQSLSSAFFGRFSAYELMVIPTFILMGQLMFKAGAGEHLFHAANKWLGHLPGGLAIAAIAACAGFAAISGSAIATAATIGAVALPAMLGRGYPKSLAAGTVAAGGTLGVLIPPSVAFIIYGILVNESISTLFMAGIVPGLLLAAAFCMAVYLLEANRLGSFRRAEPKASWVERIKSLSGVWDSAILFVCVIGGMFAGIFTPNEAGAVGAFGALLLGLIRRSLVWAGIKEALGETVKTSAMVIFIVFGAAVFSTFLTLTRIPFTLANTITEQGWPDLVVLLAILAVFVIGGMIMEILPLIILTVPIFAPVISALGYDLIWFGVIIVLLGQLGMITPPIGINAFVVASLRSDVSLGDVFRGVWPFIIALCCIIALLVVVPALATWFGDILL